MIGVDPHDIGYAPIGLRATPDRRVKMTASCVQNFDLLAPNGFPSAEHIVENYEKPEKPFMMLGLLPANNRGLLGNNFGEHSVRVGGKPALVQVPLALAHVLLERLPRAIRLPTTRKHDYALPAVPVDVEQHIQNQGRFPGIRLGQEQFPAGQSADIVVLTLEVGPRPGRDRSVDKPPRHVFFSP